MTFQIVRDLSYLLASVLFIFGLKRLSSPATARAGNVIAATGMLIAIVVTLLDQAVLNYTQILVAIAIGSLIGAVAARAVKMTAMPQMVGIFNGFGGGASALVAAAEYWRSTAGSTGELSVDASVSIMAGVLIGAVTFSGSFIAFGKLQGFITGRPVTYPLQKSLNALMLVAAAALSAYLVAVRPDLTLFMALAGVALALGITSVIPIGGADMPVIIALLNSYSGLAASAAGFAIDNKVLIISGALVGASGLILTRIMCVAMNRSLANVLFGAVGTADVKGAVGSGGAVDTTVRETNAEEAAIMLAYAGAVTFVPGYGLAVAQAQHVLRELADVLKGRGVEVKYAIHPVAGRMPGHMNVLLAEANVPYDELFDMEAINPSFERTDVAVVVGANDVVNPAARHDATSPIYGMPILDVDKARHVVVLKRSMRPGFAGVDNELFYSQTTSMLFGDAKDSITTLVGEVKHV